MALNVNAPGNRRKNPDGTIYDDRYAGPGALQRPASGAAQDIVKPLSVGQQQTFPSVPAVPFDVGSTQTTRTTQPTGPAYSSQRKVSISSNNQPYTTPKFSPSDQTLDYFNQMNDLERPGPFQSRYENQIQSILDNILNPKSFDLQNDKNYQNLYNQYAQQYMAQGNRAMRDQLGASAALTGGYGSTASQVAASQAYDNYLQNLNDRNMQLMNLAYQMYGDERADRYNQLNAFNNSDQIDYGRYRDDVSDFYQDRNWLTDMYNNSWNRDFNTFTDSRDFDRSVYENDRNYNFNLDETEYQRYQDALNTAMKYTSQGLAVPKYLADQIQGYTGANIDDVLAAMPQSSGGSGGSGRSSSGSGRSSRSKAAETEARNPAGNQDENYTTLSDVVRVMNDPNVSAQTVLDTIELAREWYQNDEYIDNDRKGGSQDALDRLDEMERLFIHRYSDDARKKSGTRGAR